MRKLKLYIAVSLDGYIAPPDGSLDWFSEFTKTNSDNGYYDLMESIDTIIMSGETYHEFVTFDVEWLYKNKTTYVVSRHNTNLNKSDNLYFITENFVERISNLKNESGKDIWLAGGGKLITMILNRDLIDEMQICYIPKILSKGISLFPDCPKQSKWKIIKNELYESGILKVDYQRV